MIYLRILGQFHLCIEISFLLLLQGKKLPPNIDENAEEGDVSDEDSADEMEDDCKLMNGDVRTPFDVFWSVSSRCCVPVFSRLSIHFGMSFQFVVVYVRIRLC